MGCVSSTLLNTDDDFTHIGTASLGHHIVSLTSTTYGLLSLDPQPTSHHHHLPTTPPPRLTLTPLAEPRSLRLDSPEVINSWELMAGLDPTSENSFRFSNPLLPPSIENSNPNLYASLCPTKGENRVNASCVAKYALDGIEKLCPPEGENSNPNLPARSVDFRSSVFYKPLNASCLEECALDGFEKLCPPKGENRVNATCAAKYALDGFEKLCPPKGENRVVIYTTTLRGVRKTFEACNAVRAAIEGLGVAVCERDVSMDRGFREELRELMKGKDSGELVPPRVFVRGRYVGGAEEVMRVSEDGCLGELLKGLPEVKVGGVCEGCGGARFLPCFSCNGSCKMVMEVKEEKKEKDGRTVVVRCPDCNENGLVLCPICS
ncbi:uncharacterized protein At5g39865-like [Rhododendron vialii]|uniref:uncharacterized protein At5g39865-like n=1 Tax=Rhododendron vialii TaxID=182163 RepID=UPI00265F0009|nr:uncharacterized protein At5g39865-like [Rhododendron vialii]